MSSGPGARAALDPDPLSRTLRRRAVARPGRAAPGAGGRRDLMTKLILMSVILMLIVLPTIAAGVPDPRLAVKRASLWTFAGVCLWVLMVVFVYPRFVG